MKKHTILLVVISCFFVSLTSGTIPDADIIYHIQPTEGEYYSVDIEVHSRTNSTGKILVRDNGTILVPEALRSFSPCIPNYSSCELSKNGTWGESLITYSLLKELSIQLPKELSCEFNNGYCQLNCQDIMGQPKCSCSQEYTLNSDNRTCKTSNLNNIILGGNSGSLRSPNHPSNYNNNDLRKWLIVTPIRTQIQLDIPNLVTESGYDFLKMYSADTNASWSGGYSSQSVKSRNNIMRLVFTSDASNTYLGFSATYKTEPVITSKTKYMTLYSNAGTMKFQLKSMPECLSLMYSLPSLGSVEVLVENDVSRFITFSEVYKKEVDGWTISRQVPDVQINNTRIPKYLFINWKGAFTKILKIAECAGDGQDVYNFGKFTWTADNLPKLRETATIADKSKCYNGGMYNASSNVCICSPGFTGNQCEEACGPNRYGDNCSGVCSWLKSGCKNMIFCIALDKCMCATGYTGKTCNEECSQNYGSNCINDCGHCKDSSVCDIYTGECSAGCIDGYYPPYCQERYVTIKYSPTIEDISWHSVSVKFNLGHLEGRGKPYLYVVQYKRKLLDDSHWIKMMPQEIKEVSNVVVKLNGLKAGYKYLSKVVLISEDGNSYKGPHVRETEFETLCEVPNSRNYDIKVINITSSAFTFEWKFHIMSDKCCEISSYKIIMKERWRKYYQEIASYEPLQATYRNLWAGHQYEVLVCPKTHQGIAPCTSPFKITTFSEAPGKVKYLKVNSTSARNIHLSWKRPLFTGGLIKGYRIQYQCLQYYICNETCEHSKGTVETSQMSTRIAGLLPYAQYKIRVAAYSTNQGPFTNIFAMTHSTKPETAPKASEEPLISKSNTSATFQWKPPNCFGLNGNFKEYFFTWCPTTGNTLNVSFTGTTNDTKATINDLKAKTDYLIHVHVVNTHGWNPEYKLVIPFSTSATVPDVVTDLEVYKSGRRMIGIRWGKPTKIYGILKSFTVLYYQKDSDQQISKTIPPTPCLSWPNLYCHTIHTNIKPDQYYVIGVKAQNNEIKEDGKEAKIIAQSRESAPEAPSYLQIVKSNSTSFSMEWGIPNKFNGELRSFLVNVEHIEALNDDDCCEYFPVQELPFREESSNYSLQVDGLVPSSTYIISVSAKTILLGPSVNFTFNTSPLPQSSLIAPQIIPLKGGSYSIKIINEPKVFHPKLRSLFLLLVLSDHVNITSRIWDEELSNQIVEVINTRNFYIVSEFQMNETVADMDIFIGTGENSRNGTIGVVRDPEFTPGRYQIGLALLQTFGGASTVSFKASNTFNFPYLE